MQASHVRHVDLLCKYTSETTFSNHLSHLLLAPLPQTAANFKVKFSQQCKFPTYSVLAWRSWNDDLCVIDITRTNIHCQVARQPLLHRQSATAALTRVAAAQTDRQTDCQTDRQTDCQTDRQSDRQTDSQTDRQTDRQTRHNTGWESSRWQSTDDDWLVYNDNTMSYVSTWADIIVIQSAVTHWHQHTVSMYSCNSMYIITGV